MDKVPRSMIRTFRMDYTCPEELEDFWDVIASLPVERERYTKVVSPVVAESIFRMEEFQWVDIMQAAYFVAGESLRLLAQVQKEAFKHIPKDDNRRMPSLMVLRPYPDLTGPNPPLLPDLFIYFLADQHLDHAFQPILRGLPLSRDVIRDVTEECHAEYRKHDTNPTHQPRRTRSPSPPPSHCW